MISFRNGALSVLLAALAFGAVYAAAERGGKGGEDSSRAIEGESPAETPPAVVTAYYFHGFARCRKCLAMEAYAAEALKKGFPAELKSGRLVFSPVNTDKPENEHFNKDYALFTRALVFSLSREGREVKWKNLSRIWQLVGDKEAFIEYVQRETREFLEAEDE